MKIPDKPKSNSQRSELYEKISGIYDILSIPELNFTRKAINYLEIRKNSRVLDIGCGTGSALKEIQEQSTGSAYAFGIDLSLGMCRQAAKKMRKMGSESTLITQGNALRLPFRTAAFDSILLSFTLETFELAEMSMVLEECRHVLSPNGRVCLVHILDAVVRHPVYQLYQWSHRRFPKVVDCRPIETTTILQDTGFQIQKTELHSMYGIPVKIVVAEKQQKEIS